MKVAIAMAVQVALVFSSPELPIFPPCHALGILEGEKKREMMRWERKKSWNSDTSVGSGTSRRTMDGGVGDGQMKMAMEKRKREKKKEYEMMRRKEEKKWLWLVRGMRKERKNGFHGNGPNGMVVCVRERERIGIGGRKDLKNCQISQGDAQKWF